jgi:hypothetical protein
VGGWTCDCANACHVVDNGNGVKVGMQPQTREAVGHAQVCRGPEAGVGGEVRRPGQLGSQVLVLVGADGQSDG